MTTTAWRFICLIGAVAMVAVAAVSATMGGCTSLLELANGNSVPMKCHWTFVADMFIGIIGVVIALLGMTCKDQSGRRASGIGLIACALVAACMPASFGIGLCANPEMHCHMTAAIVWALCAIAAIMGIIQIVKSNPESANLPKRSL